MKDTHMKVGIVTVTYNSRDVLEEFLVSIERQTNQAFTLYVVDSASTDSTVEFVSAHAENIRVIANSANIGFAAGTNQGIRAAIEDGCNVLLLINNDVVFGPNLIDELLIPIAQGNCDMTCPLMYFHTPRDVIWAAGGKFLPWLGYVNSHRGIGQADKGQYRALERVTFAPFCCVMIRKQVFEKVGLLDEEFFTYAEDADFMYRCLKQGVSLWYVPEAQLWHKVSSLTGTLSDFAIRYSVRGRIYFLHKHLGPFASWAWTLAHFCDFVFQFVMRKNSWRIMVLKFRAALEGFGVYRTTLILSRR